MKTGQSIKINISTMSMVWNGISEKRKMIWHLLFYHLEMNLLRPLPRTVDMSVLGTSKNFHKEFTNYERFTVQRKPSIVYWLSQISSFRTE